MPDLIAHVREKLAAANILQQQVQPFGVLVEALPASVTCCEISVYQKQSSYKFTMNGCAIFRKILTSLLT
mgnify:CR=1|tara:strand:+ start:236 stop:445 length:210 start_codon:yes stop_codon:yes gene_type:complete